MTAASGGLRNVVVGESRISSIDGARGILAYRGIDIHALAEASTFEEVVFLLHEGRLPGRAELQACAAELTAARPVPEGLIDIQRRLPPGTHPMTALRTLVSALGAYQDGAAPADQAALRR